MQQLKQKKKKKEKILLNLYVYKLFKKSSNSTLGIKFKILLSFSTGSSLLKLVLRSTVRSNSPSSGRNEDASTEIFRLSKSLNKIKKKKRNIK
jgi:hypothetical protein